MIPLVLFRLQALHPLPLPPAPQVIAVLIGTNNEMDSRPAAKLHVLLTWLERAYPASQLLVIPPPPSWQRRYIQLRDAYGAMLRAHPRVFFSLCGAGLDPSSFDDMKDGVRPGRRVCREALGCGEGQDGGLVHNGAHCNAASISQCLMAHSAGAPSAHWIRRHAAVPDDPGGGTPGQDGVDTVDMLAHAKKPQPLAFMPPCLSSRHCTTL